MKRSFFRASALILVFLSGGAFALERVVIRERPVVIQKEGEVYVAPADVATTSDYYYFNVDDTKRVCYKTVQPSFTNVGSGPLAVRIGSNVVNLHCYNYDPNYFTEESPAY